MLHFLKNVVYCLWDNISGLSAHTLLRCSIYVLCWSRIFLVHRSQYICIAVLYRRHGRVLQLYGLSVVAFTPFLLFATPVFSNWVVAISICVSAYDSRKYSSAYYSAMYEKWINLSFLDSMVTLWKASGYDIIISKMEEFVWKYKRV